MKKVYLLAFLAIFSWLTQAQPLTGIKTIPGDYASIAAAVTDLNTQGVGSGGVTFNVAAGHTETISATIVLTATGTAANPIVFQKSGTGANPLITAYSGGTGTPGSATPDGIWALSGSDYVTIDGIDLVDPNTTNPATMEFGYGLFKASAIDGCQYVTIKNCTITLNKVNNASGSGPMVEGSVGILVINSTRTAATTALTPTASLGSNSFNSFYANTIQNCNYGIALSGFAATSGVGPSPNPATFLGDMNNDIGGTSSSTGNTILNYGGAPSATNPAAGIRANNQWSINISYNTVNNNDGSGVNHVSTLRGIFAQAGTSANATINYNNVTIKGGGTTQQVAAIESGIGGTPAGNTVSISNNTITGEYLTATTGVFYGIFNNGVAPATLNIQNNTVQNLNYSSGSLAGSGAVYPIYTTGTNSASTFNITGNTVNNITRTGTTGGTTIGIFASTGTSGMTYNVNNNTVSNMSISGTGSSSIMYGIQTATGTITVNNNNVYNLQCTKTSGTGALYGIFNIASPTNETVNNNTVYDLTHNGTGIVYGIYHFTTTGTRTMSGNTVYNITGAGTTIAGIVNAASSPTVFNNRIYNIQSTNNTSPTVSGILLTSVSSGNAIFYNNFISEIKAPNASTNTVTSPAVRGINITSTSTSTNVHLYYNTVYLNASSSGTNFGSAAIFHTANATATTSNLTMRNNIFVNNSTPNGTGRTVAYQCSSTNLANYNSASNNNLFYAGTVSTTNLIFYDGTNSDQTIAEYKTRVAPRDGNSFTEDPPFVNVTTPPYDLQIQTTVPTQIESGGVPITVPVAITTDYFSTTRNATSPDVGAHEGAFTILDLTPPSISYTVLGNGIVAATRTFNNVTITDPSGVNTASGTKPRVYYKKSTDANTFAGNTSADNGWKFVEASNTSSPFNFTIDYTILNGGSVSVGDVIQYFVVAQDLATTPNVGINSGTFASTPSSVSLTAANFPITGTINQFNIAIPLSGTVTVGTGGTYSTLTGTSGLFDAINNALLGGNLIAEVISDITEPGTIALNEIAEVSPGGYTLTIRPDAATLRNITGNIANGLIRLNGADRVIIDGRFSGSGNYFSFINNNNTASAATIWVNSVNASNPATDITIRNITAKGGGASTLAAIVVSGSTLGGVAETDNTNIQIRETVTERAQYGIAVVGPTSGQTNLVVEGNTVGSTVAADKISFQGMFISNQNGALIQGNTVSGISSPNNDNNSSGITIAGNTTNTVVNANILNDIVNSNTSGWGTSGIRLSSTSTASNTRITNNVIYNVRGYGWASNITDNGHGIRITAGGGYTIAYNSVNLATNQTIAGQSSAILISSGSNLDIRNNVFVNTQTTGTRYAIFSSVANTAYSQINFNNYFSTQHLGYLTSNRTSLSDWQTATNQDGMSIVRDPNFTSSTNLLPTDFNGYFAQPISGITTDINGSTRSTAAPAKGAFEGTVPGVWLGSTSAWTNTANWSDGSVPGASTMVAVINSTVTQPEITTAVTNTNFMGIASGCTLTVSNGGALTTDSLRLFGNITLDASASGYGSLIESVVTGTGTISRRMYLNASTPPNNGRWYTIGSPFAVPINQLHDGTSEFDVTNATESPFRIWNAGTGDYELPTGSTMPFERGRGYVAFFGEFVGSTFIRPVPGNITVTGNYGNAANVTRLLGYTSSPTFPTIDGPTDGWNLLANPYLSSYDWNGQTLGPNTGGAIYVRNAANTGWVTWNTSETTNRRYIPPMQGFWIRTTLSENLTFDIAQRSTNSTQVIEKPSAQEVLTRIKVTNTATGHDDRAVISFHNDGSAGFDRLLDGYKLRNDAGMHNVYSRSQNLSLALNYLPAFSGTASVPVWFENDQQGTYTFAINRDDIDPSIEITLEDKQTNATFTFQSSQSVYTFTHTPQMGKDRFILHYNKVNIGQDEYTARGGIKGLQAWYFDGRINLKSLGFHGPVTARLVDVSGKRIAEEVVTISTGELTRWNVPSLKPGVYMVQLITREGQTIVKFVY
ncbi:hypothetical protein JCM31826_13670 [Thermaurantimonas aggregans]|uniref:Secretion system C-terminal sorting domain-containing protein n=1 Tax=Thermaurantimonas aggregans TaxID=2173829 RepID=A0A401XLH4_9FLAO|nr:T9SS type A sorting domain-containing protein [Thermaurantimonas aggregans]GCD77885.1 hypothetical protein JCM31826_13670 [Thermaurantimonas aggregans]